MRVERFERIAVQFRRTHAAAERCAQHERHAAPSLRAKAHARDLLADLVERLVREPEKLDLGDRPHAGHGQPERRADDRRFGERHVDDARVAVLREEAVRRAEHAAEGADVLAEHHDALVVRHRLVERGPNGLHHRHLGHQRSPRVRSARCRSNRDGGCA